MSGLTPIPMYKGSPVAILPSAFGIGWQIRGEFNKYCPYIKWAVQQLFDSPCDVEFWEVTEKHALFTIHTTTPTSAGIPEHAICRFALHKAPEFCLNFESEMATMEYIRSNVSVGVPVPNVYGYETTGACFGYPFVVMAHMKNSDTIHNSFDKLSRHQQKVVITQYAQLLVNFSQLSRSGPIGAIASWNPNCHEGTLTAPSIRRRNPLYGWKWTQPNLSPLQSFPDTRSWLLSSELEADAFTTKLMEEAKLEKQERERLEDAHRILLQTQEAIIRVCDTNDTVSLGLPYLTARDILIKVDAETSGESNTRVGSIVGVLDFQGAGFYPTWAFGCFPPPFLCFTSTDLNRPEQERKENEEYFQDALLSHSRNTLYEILSGRYRLKQMLVRAVVIDEWTEMTNRRNWLQYDTYLAKGNVSYIPTQSADPVTNVQLASGSGSSKAKDTSSKREEPLYVRWRPAPTGSSTRSKGKQKA